MDYQIGIIGAGIVGCFSLLRLLENNYSKKIGVFELGRPFAKRRRQLEGALGCLPAGDGKFYLNDYNQFSDLDKRYINKIKKYINNELEEISPIKLIQDSNPSVLYQKKFAAAGYELETNDYFQWKPDSIHSFSKNIASKFDKAENITFHFDTQVFKITKKKNGFIVNSEAGEFTCKTLIFAPGRSGWRWATEFFQELGIIVDNKIARFGARFEIAASHLKEFNKSNLTLTKPMVKMGPFNWHGTIMPEDHADMVISCFRSNESRWHTEKVSFPYTREVEFENGVGHSERIAKLTYLLFNDRVSKEKNKVFLKGHSQLNLLPEYDWLHNSINELDELIPGFILKGNYHVPHIDCIPAKIELSSHLETNVKGLYVGGEAAGISGILGASISGTIIADGICQG